MHRRCFGRFEVSILFLDDLDGMDGTDLAADVAPDTDRLLDDVMMVRIHRDGFDGTMLRATGAAEAGICHVILNQSRAFSHGTLAADVSLEFIPVVAQAGEDRVRRGFAETTEAALNCERGEGFEFFEIAFASFAGAKPFENLFHAHGADSAVRAFAAGFVLAKGHEIAGDIHDAIGVIEDDHSARTHDCTDGF